MGDASEAQYSAAGGEVQTTWDAVHELRRNKVIDIPTEKTNAFLRDIYRSVVPKDRRFQAPKI